MTSIRVLTTTLTVVMFGMIVVSIVTGDFRSEGREILDLAWGRMSIIDLYVGVILIFGWVLLREKNPWVSLVWFLVFVVLGNAGTALYASIAAFRSDDIRTFLLGHRALDRPRA